MSKAVKTVFMMLLFLPAVLSAQIREEKPDWRLLDEKVFIPSHPYSLFKTDTVTITLIGDVMMHSPQFENAHKLWMENESVKDGVDKHWQYDFSTFFAGIAGDLGGADLAVANMEFTLGGMPFSGYPCFSSPDSYADYVASLGVDVFLTSNNHILDKAPSGAARTLRYYSSKGMRYTGSGLDSLDFASRNPLMLRCKGLSIAIINFTYGTNVSYGTVYPRIQRQSEMDEIIREIRRARDNGADVIIAIPHWGKEYKYVHDAEQAGIARKLAENGADVIIGAHPHVVQDMEIIRCSDKEVPVYYSLGNAISNMSAPGTQLELMAHIKVVRYKDGDVSLLPVTHEWLWCSRPGDICPGYCVVKVAGQKRDEWHNLSAFDKMISTLDKVRNATGLN